eukprot:s5727_g1.t1
MQPRGSSICLICFWRDPEMQFQGLNLGMEEPTGLLGSEARLAEALHALEWHLEGASMIVARQQTQNMTPDATVEPAHSLTKQEVARFVFGLPVFPFLLAIPKAADGSCFL